jgi:hypothetical protein
MHEKLPSDGAISLSLLTVSYFARPLKVFERSAQWSQTWFREKSGSWLRTLYNHSADSGNIAWWNIFPFYVFTIYCFGRALCDAYESRVFELLWLSCSFAFGCTKIFVWRNSTPPGYRENDWTFGKTLAVLSLMLPLLALPELYAGK